MAGSHGFWAPGDGTVREFDEVFEELDEPYSRSKRIIEAMRLYTMVHRVFLEEGVEPEVLDERHVRFSVRAALQQSLREEADE